MTCFWDGILTAIDDNLFQKVLGKPKCMVKCFITELKMHNKQTQNVLWNGSPLINQQLEENFQAVNEFNINGIYGGYDCSTFDPFLFLVSEIFNVDIIHNFNGAIINYNNINNIHGKISFASDRGHFWFCNR